MKRKNSRIPAFKSHKEEAEFWDTHSFADYQEEFRDIEMKIELAKPRTETLIVRMQKDMKEKMRVIARKQGLNVSTMARMWMMEKLKAV
jgi:DNA/RNA-binding domain of Phe-tRNA-synthetase-like protein